VKHVITHTVLVLIVLGLDAPVRTLAALAEDLC